MKGTILFVDDEPNMLQLMRQIFGDEGYEVLTAPGGPEALRILETRLPDLIVSDIIMPLMDGFSFFKEVKRRLSEARPAFVFLTAKNSESDVIEGLTLGVDDYITKPFSPRSLLAKVENILNRYFAVKNSVTTGFMGNLKNQGIVDIVKFMEIAKHTGHLTVRSKGKTGVLRVREGDVISAEFPPLNGKEAVFAMMALEDGSFRFDDDPEIGTDDSIGLQNYSLILEGLRLMEEEGRQALLAPVFEDSRFARGRD